LGPDAIFLRKEIKEGMVDKGEWGKRETKLSGSRKN
jgi:hypothetical protein